MNAANPNLRGRWPWGQLVGGRVSVGQFVPTWGDRKNNQKTEHRLEGQERLDLGTHPTDISRTRTTPPRRVYPARTCRPSPPSFSPSRSCWPCSSFSSPSFRSCFRPLNSGRQQWPEKEKARTEDRGGGGARRLPDRFIFTMKLPRTTLGTGAIDDLKSR